MKDVITNNSTIRVEEDESYLMVGFYDEGDAKEFKSKCPKYLGADYHFCESPEWMSSSQYGNFEKMYRFVFRVRDDSNGVTGEKNEAAIRRRNKVHELIKGYKS